MKNIILIAIISLSILSACKKENQNTAPAGENKQNLEQLILNFEQKLNSGQKDGTVYDADSAVWYVEALLNYSFCEAGNQCHDIVVDTLWTTVNDPGTNGFTIEQLETVFDALESDISENQPENKIVFAIDVYAYQSGNLTVFEARTAYAALSEPAFKATADTTGAWFWGGDDGMCGPDYGKYIGMDASDVLENRISNTTSDIWSSLETISVWPTTCGDPNFPFEITYLQPTRLFYARGPYYAVLDFCIPPNVMDYYLSSSGIPYVIDDVKPSGKSFAYCSIDPIQWDSLDVGHYAGFTYGIPVH